jgi:glycosyltransferase 2 family protein
MIRAQLSRPWVRALVGLAISTAFIVATVATVERELLAQAWATVGMGLLLVAVAVSIVELNVRAVRWRLLLRSLAPVGYGVTLGYLSIGHLANAILPARLGDLARALASGVRLRVSRTSVLGTIALERVSDASLLGLAVAVGALVGFRQLAPAVGLLVAGAAVAGAATLGIFLVLRRQSVARTRIGGLLHDHGARFWAGANGLRGPGEILAWVALTATSFALTVGIFSIGTAAVGLSMPIWQAALVMAAVTLSTAIPTGPASIGTYEFVGMTVMVSMGFSTEHSLLCVALVHAIVVVPPSLMGLGAMCSLGVRPHAPKLASTHQPALVERAG